MSDRTTKATLSKGRSGWCVIFRHPVCQAPNGKQRLRVRRGLATRDESKAQELVDQLNEILGNPSFWALAERERAGAKYDTKIVAAFFDHLAPSEFDPWQFGDDKKIDVTLISIVSGCPSKYWVIRLRVSSREMPPLFKTSDATSASSSARFTPA